MLRRSLPLFVLALGACGTDVPGTRFGDLLDGAAPDGSLAGDAGDGGTGGDSATTPGNPSNGPGPGCGSVTIESDATVVEEPGNVLVLFDRSLSMADPFDTPSGSQPRWQAAGDALVKAIEPLGDRLTVGSILFPSVFGTLFCTADVDGISSAENIDFMPGAEFIEAWQAYWAPGGSKLNFGTWINRAFERAEEALTGTTLSGNTAVVLFSDGEPVCQQGVMAYEQAAVWAQRGIATHVVGLPGALGSSYLSSIAQSGGQSDFLTPADSAELQVELERIVKSTVRSALDTCTLQLDPPPQDPSKVFLVVEDGSTGERFQVPRERAPGDGWQLEGDRTVTLQGPLCDEARGGRFSEVTFEFGCVDLPVLY